MLAQIKRDALRLLEVRKRLGMRYALRRSFDALIMRTIGRARHRGDRTKMLEIENAEKRFTQIYEHNYWKSGESRSGAGSTLDAAHLFAAEIKKFIESRNIKVLLDAPCGDWNWMRHVELPLDLKYLGGDIVAPLIETLIEKHGGDNRYFFQFDICKDSFPAAEVWLCRDCLFHLSFSDIASAFENFSKSECSYALITTHYEHPENRDIETGDFRFLNLSANPFNLPRPSEFLEEKVVNEVRMVGLWSRQQIADALARYRNLVRTSD
jgi:hypothetical protein